MTDLVVQRPGVAVAAVAGPVRVHAVLVLVVGRVVVVLAGVRVRIVTVVRPGHWLPGGDGSPRGGAGRGDGSRGGGPPPPPRSARPGLRARGSGASWPGDTSAINILVARKERLINIFPENIFL